MIQLIVNIIYILKKIYNTNNNINLYNCSILTSPKLEKNQWKFLIILKNQIFVLLILKNNYLNLFIFEIFISLLYLVYFSLFKV